VQQEQEQGQVSEQALKWGAAGVGSEYVVGMPCLYHHLDLDHDLGFQG
jgi:hypothetical protein